MKTKIYILFIIIGINFILGAVVLSSTPKVTTVDTIATTDVVDVVDEPLILTFEKVLGRLYTYELAFNGEDVKITYTFDNNEPIIERGKHINDKIIVDGCDDCYELVNTACDGCQLRWELCVYNPESDGKDCYSYNDLKSNGIVMDLY